MRRLRLTARLLAILGVLIWYAGSTLPGWAYRRLRRGRDAAYRYAVSALPRLLVALGPAFVKGGQILCTRGDLIGPDVRDALRVLCRHVPVRRMGGLPSPEAFGSGAAIDPVPCAAGSIATVHRVTFDSGRTVAVKVRRPGILAELEIDVALVRAGARLVARHRRLRRIPVAEMMDQIGATVLRQADFATERRHLRMLAGNLGACPGVRVPGVVELSPSDLDESVIVMEYIADLRPLEAATVSAEARPRYARAILDALYRMLFVDGLVHCDLHPGNLCVDTVGDVVILDAGFVVRLPDQVRQLFAEFFFSMAMGRGERCADIVLESAAGISEDADLAGFRKGISDLITQTSRARSEEFSLTDFAARLFDLQRHHGIFGAPEFAFPLLSMLMVEIRVRELDPTLDFQARAVPVLMSALA